MRIALVIDHEEHRPYAEKLSAGLARLEHEANIWTTEELTFAPSVRVYIGTMEANFFDDWVPIHAMFASPGVFVAFVATNDDVSDWVIRRDNNFAFAHRSFIPDATALYNHLLYRPPAA